ncbi:MAG: adenylate/guanylate cyclase domain-containing protein [Bacteroidota bacterium]
MPDSIRAEEWMRLAEHEAKNWNITSALRYALQALDYYEEKGNYANLYRLHLQLGDIYAAEKLYAKAIEYYRSAEKLLPSSKQELTVRLAETYAAMKQIDSATYYYDELLDYRLRLQDTNQVIDVYQDLVNLHNQFGQARAALRYNQKLLPLIDAKGQPQELATIYNNIGFNYNVLKDYERSAEYFLEAAKIAKKYNVKDIASIYTNVAISFQNSGDQTKSLDYLRLALNNTPTNAIKERLEIENLISAIYLYETDYYNAQQHNESVLIDRQAQNFPELLSEAYLISAGIYEALYDFEKALTHYQAHLQIRDSLRLSELIRQQELLQQQVLLEQAEQEIKLLLVNEEVKDLQINQLELAKEKLQLESQKQEGQLELLRQEKEIELANTRAKTLEIAQANQELELSKQRLFSQQQKSQIVLLQQQEQERELLLTRQRLTLADKEAAEKEKQREIDQLQKQREIDQLKLDQDENFRRFIYGLIAMLGLILALILAGLLYFRKASQTLSRQNKQIEAQKSEIEKQRNESDQLLLNILPSETAQELKVKGSATPRKYDLVTVIFSDFSGFTKISADMSPEILIEELNICFKAFDEIIERHNLEKIKTIGDAYMCAGGIPVPNSSNPMDAVAASLEMKAFMDKRIQQKAAVNEPYWQMRLGIHSGPCIAGVVGSKKFAYDIWGDTVNTANRIESSGLINKVNISEDTYQLIKDHFACTFRGEIDVRHKGKIRMYLVNGQKVAAEIGSSH